MKLYKTWKRIKDRRRLKRRFFRKHGYPLNLRNPRSLSEKVHWIKRYCDLEPLSEFVDKYTVRAFIEERIGSHYLIPMVGIYDRFEDIDFDALPQRFAVKATHGCGWNIMVRDKSSLDREAICSQVNDWLNRSFYDRAQEANYKNLKGRILIEELLCNPHGSLDDYKFYCCNGVPLGAHVDIDRFGNHQYRTFDAEWNEFEKNDPVKASNIPQIPKPEKLEEMLEVCRRLSEGFPYVRVDLYYASGKIYFGELTFTPANGLYAFDPTESDFYFGAPFDVFSLRHRPYIQKAQHSKNTQKERNYAEDYSRQ